MVGNLNLAEKFKAKSAEEVSQVSTSLEAISTTTHVVV